MSKWLAKRKPYMASHFSSQSGEGTGTLKLSFIRRGDAAQVSIGDWPPVHTLLALHRE